MDRLYQVHTEPVFTGPETTTVDRWFVAWVKPLAKVAAVAVITSGIVGPVFTPPAQASTPQIFDQFSQPTRFPTLSASAKQSFAIDPLALTRPETTTVDRWFQSFSEPLRFAKSAALMPVATQSTLPLPNPPFTDIRWFSPLSDIARPPRGLTAALQSSAVIDPTALTLKEATSLDRWWQPFSEPVRFRTRAPEAEAYTPFAPVPSVALDSWYRSLEQPVRLRPSLAPALQPFAANDTLPRAEATTLDRWYVRFSEPARLKPGLTAALQLSFATDTNPSLRPLAIIIDKPRLTASKTQPALAGSKTQPDLDGEVNN